jgi:2-oxoglutarate ferredoxin oxidoreductase subunit beta
MALALGADASFIARSMDRDPKHLQSMLVRAHGHKGTSFLEIYQNCNIFNDGAFEAFTEKSSKADNALFAEHGKPLVFGANSDKGIRLDGFRPVVFYQVARPTYETVMKEQIDWAKEKKPADLDKLLRGNEVWDIV